MAINYEEEPCIYNDHDHVKFLEVFDSGSIRICAYGIDPYRDPVLTGHATP
jgi:hypothetical protein